MTYRSLGDGTVSSFANTCTLVQIMDLFWLSPLYHTILTEAAACKIEGFIMATTSELELKELKTRDEFIRALKDAGDKLMVVDFFASWCTPCVKIVPFVRELAATYTNVVFCKVNVDENTETAEYYGIKAMPTFMLFRNGFKIERLQGADRERLKALIDQHYTEEK